MNLSALFIRRPIATVLVMLTVVVFGCLSYFNLPVSDMPSVDYPAITVNVRYPGAKPETIANNVLTPLEKQFLSIEGVQTIASTSSTGSGTIVLQFSLKKKLDSAALDVQTAIAEAAPQLPHDLPYAPTYTKVNPSASPVIYFALTSTTLPRSALYTYSNTFLAERLSTIDGVAQVGTYGSPYAVRIQLDPQKLAAKEIGLDEIAQAIQSQSVEMPTGNLYGSTREYTINVDGQLKKAEAFNSIIIKNRNGSIVRVQDVGQAVDSLSHDKQSMRHITGTSEINCVVLSVQVQPGANTMSVIHQIDQMLPSLEAALPQSIDLIRQFDKSEFIEEAVADVQLTLVLAFLLVVGVIFFYLGKIRDTLIPTLSLPITILGTFVVMSLLGYSIDILSLLAITLSVGFLVDDAIVVLENIVRHVEQGKTALQAALDGSKQICFTIISMTLSLSSVFIPLLFMSGIMGRLFHEFAMVIIIAMIISGIISLSLTPMLCSQFVQPRLAHASLTRMQRYSKEINHRLVTLYAKTLKSALNYPKTILLSGCASVVLSLGLFKILPADFLPPDDIGCFVIYAQGMDGTSPFQMMKYQEQIIPLVKKNPYVDSAVSLAPYPIDNKGFMFVKLIAPSKRPSMASVIRELQQEIRQVVGIQAFLKPYPLINMQVSTSDINATYQYTLQGLDTQALYQAADQMVKKLKALPILNSVSTDLELKQPQLNLKILRDRAAALNISSEAIERTLSLAFAATDLSPMNFPDNEYYAILELKPTFYRDPSVLSQLYVRSANNMLIPLTAVTTQCEGLGPLNINRINGLPAVNIFFNTNSVPLGTALKEIDAIAHDILPSSVQGKVQGTADVFRASFSSLVILFCITLFLIYVILGVLYENFLHPLTVMSTLPPAMLGGLLTLLIFQASFSLYAFVGLILLLGIVMKNGIILIDFANEARSEGKTALEAITAACLERFRPIVMTTLCALMGAVPIAIGIGGMTAHGREPLGLVIIGGLLFSQIVTLFLTPVVYLSLERLREKFSVQISKNT